MRDFLRDSTASKLLIGKALGALGSWLDHRHGPDLHDGMHLDPQIRAAVTAKAWIKMPEIQTAPPSKARKLYAAQIAPFDLRLEPMARVEEITIPGPAGPLPVRIFWPEGAAQAGPKGAASTRGAPALVWFHGGGFVVGSPRTCEPALRRMAARGRFVALSVGYRLAPEDPCPAAHDDALAAWRYLTDHAEAFGLDPARIAIGGDSAGGNLAACVCLKARDDDAIRAPAFQALVYPATDFTRSMASHETFAEGYMLTRALANWFLDQYIPNGVAHIPNRVDPIPNGVDPVPNGVAHIPDRVGRSPRAVAVRVDRRDPAVSPLFAKDLSGLPPGVILTAGFDILRDEGRAYARSLQRAGNDVEDNCAEGLVHGFFSLSGVVDAARNAIDNLAAQIASGLSIGG